MTNLVANKNKESKRNFAVDQFHNIVRLFDVSPIFLRPQVKQWAIITYKHGIYELPHKLSNDLKLRMLGIRKYQESV